MTRKRKVRPVCYLLRGNPPPKPRLPAENQVAGKDPTPAKAA